MSSGRDFVFVLFIMAACGLVRSQDVPVHNVFGLVRSVGRSTVLQTETNDSLTKGCVEALDGFLDIFANDNGENISELSDSSTFSLDALDFVMGSCLRHGFYDTGDWRSFVPSFTKFYEGTLPEYVAELVRPVMAPISSPICFRPGFNRMHWGVDFACGVGTPVMAALSGIVVAAGNDADGYGVYVCVVDDNGVETRYAHLSESLVEKGEHVGKGAVLAKSGDSGLSTGPHLHFELRYRGDVVDPVLFFNKK